MRRTFDELDNPIVDRGYDCPPAAFVDLTHRTSGKVIRVVSDHVPGFNGIAQKEATHQREGQLVAPTPLHVETILHHSHQERLDFLLTHLTHAGWHFN